MHRFAFIFAMSAVLLACHAEPAPPPTIAFTSASADITFKFWDGSELVDRGGQGRACDRGCISFGQEEFAERERADAGTPATAHATLARAMRCIQACAHTEPVAWPAR